MLRKSKARKRTWKTSIVTTRKVRKYASKQIDQAGNAYVKPDVTSYDHSIHMFFKVED